VKASHKVACLTAVCLFNLALSGCGSLITSATSGLADSLTNSILNSDDLATVEKGLPAYLLLLDGLIADDANNPGLLRAAASLNSAYAGLVSENTEQAQRLTVKAFDYAQQSTCAALKQGCGLKDKTFEQFKTSVDQFGLKHIDTLYTLGSSWASWIETHASDFNAIADISRVQYTIERVVKLDPNYESGTPYIYLGTLATLLPPALGGKPEIGRAYFEQAIARSSGTNLMAKSTFAQRYTRLMFDRELHDKLVEDVLTADANVPGLTLINVIAQQQARALKESADDYF